jgi:hypothetical protein
MLRAGPFGHVFYNNIGLGVKTQTNPPAHDIDAAYERLKDATLDELS